MGKNHALYKWWKSKIVMILMVDFSTLGVFEVAGVASTWQVVARGTRSRVLSNVGCTRPCDVDLAPFEPKRRLSLLSLTGSDVTSRRRTLFPVDSRRPHADRTLNGRDMDDRR